MVVEEFRIFCCPLFGLTMPARQGNVGMEFNWDILLIW
jgi:hypothetical protein